MVKKSRSLKNPILLVVGLVVLLGLVLGLRQITKEETPTAKSSQPNSNQQSSLVEYRNEQLGFKFEYPREWGNAALKTYEAVAKNDQPTSPYYQVVFDKEVHVTLVIPNKNAEVTFKTLGRNEKSGYAAYTYEYRKNESGNFCAVFPVIEDCQEWEGVISAKEAEHNGVRSLTTHYVGTTSEWPYLQGFHSQSPFASALQEGQKYQMYEVVSVYNPEAAEYRNIVLEVLDEETANLQGYMSQVDSLVPTIQKL
jgi:hypothetical protein